MTGFEVSFFKSFLNLIGAAVFGLSFVCKFLAVKVGGKMANSLA